MKKLSLLLCAALLSTNLLWAGGLVTNTNQSAAWVRMLVRDASTDPDAVFFNPAGLTKLKDGWHISISNQSLFQTQTVTSTFPFLNNQKYEGDISAPVFPGLYAAYKTGKWAFSVGFNPIGGGGGAKFEKGLPLMEIPVAAAAASFADYGVTGYSTNMSFEGTSVYWGLQAGATYQIIDEVGVYLGGRYVMARNTYQGYIKDNTFVTDAGDVPADDFMNDLSGQVAAASGLAQGAGDQIQPLVDLGLGGYTVDEAVTAGYLTAEQALLIKGGLVQFGFPPEAVNAMTIEQSQGAYYTVSAELSGQSDALAGGAFLMGDQEADITQTGNGFTPIIGVNLSFLEDKLNFGIKYEFKTKMDLTNSVDPGKGFIIGLDPETGQPVEMFPDGETTNADIPAFLSIGMGWQIIDPLKVQVGFHMYFDKGTGWSEVDDGMGGKQSVIDNNFTEYGLGLEYNVTDKLILSGGYLRANTGVNQYYQSSLNYSLTSNTFGVGGAYEFNDMFKLHLGYFNTSYIEQTYDETYSMMDGTTIAYTDTYDKATWAISVGLDISIGKK